MPQDKRIAPACASAPGRCGARIRWEFAATLGLVVLAFFAAYLRVELTRNQSLGFPLDDPWIHLTLGRNLGRGSGFAFNPGEPVAGSTAPLWTGLMALVHVFVSGPAAAVAAAKVLGAGFLFIAALYGMRIARSVTGNDWAGLAAGLAVATIAPLNWAMMSGMEVTLCAALTLAGLYYHIAFRVGFRKYLAWLLLGLAAYARPECLALAVLVSLHVAVQRIGFRQRTVYWRGLAVWALAVTPLFLLNYLLSGSPFPLTYAAKASNTSLFTALARGHLPQITGLMFVAAPAYAVEMARFLWSANPVIVLLSVVGAAAIVFRRGQSLTLPLVLFGYAPLLGMAVPVAGPAFQSGRYVGNLTALAPVVAAVGAWHLWSSVRNRILRISVVSLVGGLLTFNVVTTAAATARNTALAESSVNRMQVRLARWLAQNTPAWASVACVDVGAIGYLSGRRVIDLVGLVTEGAVEYRRRYGVRAYVELARPDYLVFYPSELPALASAPYLELATSAALADNYASEYDFRPRSRIVAGLFVADLVLVPRRAVLAVYRCDWSRRP